MMLQSGLRLFSYPTSFGQRLGGPALKFGDTGSRWQLQNLRKIVEPPKGMGL